MINVNGYQLKINDELASAARTADLTEPGGTIRAYDLGGTLLQPGGSTGGLVDDVVSGTGSARFLSGGKGDSAFRGCKIDYDFGEGTGKVVRGVRFNCPASQRRPKDLTVFGTADDPTAENATWTQLATWPSLNVKTAWTDYLAFDNDTCYRAYRLQINAVTSSDQYGIYLEFYEMSSCPCRCRWRRR